MSTIAVSPASSPPIMTTTPPTNEAAPPPLVALGRSARRDQLPSTASMQSMRGVAGDRPPATQALVPRTKPDTWLRGTGSEERTVHEYAAGSKASTAATLPRLVLPPIA